MKKEVLANGITVLYEPKPGNAVVVEVMVNVGSNDEQARERGITHFIEHMVFEGTKTRPTNKLISNEIERIGGEFNAYTTNERTCFYVKVLKKHFPIAVEVLADILQQPLFKEEHIKKERNVVIKEIDMVYDDPRFYQWVLLQSTLFKKNAAKYPTYGDKKVIRGLNKQKVLSFFAKHYLPENMVISVVGEVPAWKNKLEEAFTLPRRGRHEKKGIPEPLPTRSTSKTVRRRVANTYTVLGFPTVSKSHEDMYVLEVINGILGRGQSGWIFTEIRSKLGLAYEVGTQNVCETSFGYFSIYATVDKKNAIRVKELILQELHKVQQATPEDVREAKMFIEGAYMLEMEDAQKISDQMLAWEQAGGVEQMNQFIDKIKAVTPQDVHRVAKKYFKHPTLVVLEGK